MRFWFEGKTAKGHVMYHKLGLHDHVSTLTESDGSGVQITKGAFKWETEPSVQRADALHKVYFSDLGKE